MTIGPRPVEPLIGELVIDQERGEEKRAQQHLDVLGIGPVEGIGAARQIAMVGRGKRRPVWRTVDKPLAVTSTGVTTRSEEGGRYP